MGVYSNFVLFELYLMHFACLPNERSVMRVWESLEGYGLENGLAQLNVILFVGTHIPYYAENTFKASIQKGGYHLKWHLNGEPTYGTV